MEWIYNMKRRLLITILIPLLILFGFCYWIFWTQSGLNAVLHMAQMVEPKFTFTKAEGHLSHMMVIHEVSYQKDDIEFEAKKLKTEVSLSALFLNTISIPYIEIEEGEIKSKKLSSPIFLDALIGGIEFKTPRLREIVHIETLKGHMDEKPFHGNFYLDIQDKILKNLRGLFYFGESQFKIEPDNLSSDNEVSPQFLWELIFHSDDNVEGESKGSLKVIEAFSHFEGELYEAKIASNYTDVWTLKQKSSFTFSENHLIVKPLLFQNPSQAELFVEANWDKEKGGNLKLDIPEFALRSPELTGKISMHVDLKQNRENGVVGDGKLIIHPGKAQIKLPANKIYSSQFKGGDLTAHLENEVLNLSFKFQETARNHAELNAKMPHFSLKSDVLNEPIEGEFRGSIQDVSIAYLLVPPISRLKAIINFNGKLQGTLQDPRCSLTANLHNGIFSLPQQHIVIRDFSMSLKGEIPGRLALYSTGTSGGNPFKIRGNIEPFIPDGKNTFEVTGENVRVYNTSNMIIYATPNLDLEFENHTLFVTGNVRIPEADITEKTESASVVTSKDVVYIDKKEEDLIESLKVVPNFQLIIEDTDKVRFKGHNLDAVLRGKIKIEDRPDGLFTGLGRLTIKEGTYRLQGSKYKIQKGRLLYPPGTLLKDPIVDIRISKKRSGYVEEATEVGIYVQGTLQNPSFHLYSNDSLQNTEILSRLGFGSNEVEGEDSQRQLITQTAQFLTEGANPLIENLQNKLGLEELGIQSAESQRIITNHGGYDTVFVVGKSITDRVYLQFIRGMLEPLNILRLKYYITPRFAFGLETSSAEDIGGDVSFSMEQQ